MTDEKLPIGAKVIVVEDFGASEDVAKRLFEAGASDVAVDAAGGPGTAVKLRQTSPAAALTNGHLPASDAA